MEECVQGTTMYNLKIAVSFFLLLLLTYIFKPLLANRASLIQSANDVEKKKNFYPGVFLRVTPGSCTQRGD